MFLVPSVVKTSGGRRGSEGEAVGVWFALAVVVALALPFAFAGAPGGDAFGFEVGEGGHEFLGAAAGDVEGVVCVLR